MTKKPTRTRPRSVAGGPDAANGGSRDAEQDRRLERRLERTEQRVERLEAALEDVQDALYRQSQRADEVRDEMLKRTEPGRVARALGEDARRRGL